jgi:inosine/xanthosine triphosphate pyrophosphatase family protein
MKLVLATKNSGKVVEFRRLLNELGASDLEVVGLDVFLGLETLKRPARHLKRIHY